MPIQRRKRLRGAPTRSKFRGVGWRMLDRTHLASLDDRALLESLKGVVARSNQITALLLAHLAEVDARGAYRLWSCPTLQA